MEFCKGNTFKFRFKRKDILGNIITEKATNVWFTVKINHNTEKILIQKTLEEGSIIFGDDYYYHVVINPEDTLNLDYGIYVYDIQIDVDGEIYTLKKDGVVNLLKRVTFDGGGTNERTIN